MICRSDKYVFFTWVVQLNPCTQHTATVHTMHTGTSIQNVYFLPVEHNELVKKISPHIIRVSVMWCWVYRGCMVCIYFSLNHVFKQVGSPKCSLTDAQMIRKRRMSQDYVFLLLVYSCTQTLQSWTFWVFPGNQKNLGYQVFPRATLG